MKVGDLVKVNHDMTRYLKDLRSLRDKIGIVVDIQDGNRVQVMFGHTTQWVWNYDLRPI